MSTHTKSIYERVIDLGEYQDATFLVEGDVDKDEARRQVVEFLNETLGTDGWSNLMVHNTSTWTGGWEDHGSDDRWVSRTDGDPWTYVVTDYEMA